MTVKDTTSCKVKTNPNHNHPSYDFEVGICKKCLKFNKFCVWDAVVAWRDHIYKSKFYRNTKSNYLTCMLKLIESGIVNIYLKLNKINDTWWLESKQKIDDNIQWSKATKTIRNSCLNSFYSFIQICFDSETDPYKRHPKSNEVEFILSKDSDKFSQEQELKHIKHILSSVTDKALTINLQPKKLCFALSKINERDAYIVYLMIVTGRTLEEVLDLKKSNGDYEPPYVRFSGEGIYIQPYITDAINELCKNSVVYLFETANGKRIRRTQVTRNLKKAGRNIGLDFELTPKLLHGYVNAHMSRDTRSEIEIAMVF